MNPDHQKNPVLAETFDSGEGHDLVAEVWRSLDEQEIFSDVNMDFPSEFFNNLPSLDDIPCLSPPSVNSAMNLDAQTTDGVNLDFINNDPYYTGTMENFGLDTNGIQNSNNQEQGNNNSGGDIGEMFLEWLKNNRDSISLEEIRKIKLNENTIEKAWSRLGYTVEGRNRLVQLVLQWVQENRLRKKAATTSTTQFSPISEFQNFLDQIPNACVPDQQIPQPLPPFYSTANVDNNTIHSSSQLLVPFPCSSYMENTNQNGGIQYPYQSWYEGETSRDYKSANREARKRRMAIKKSVAQNINGKLMMNQGKNGNAGSSNGVENNWVTGSSSTCVYPFTNVSMMNPASVPVLPVNAAAYPVPVYQFPAIMHAPPMYNLQAEPEKRVEFTQDTEFQLLLQKVLQQSDINNNGRIVLPKKEAEIYLPPLATRDGIPFLVEDIRTNIIWNMRYRFWPNNKSRMYILDNTAGFVRANGLRAGDYITIHLHLRTGKYLIRGIKMHTGQISDDKYKRKKRRRCPAESAN